MSLNEIPKYLEEAIINLKNCDNFGAEDLYAESFYYFLEEAFKNNEINLEIKNILLKNSENNFKNFEI